MDAQQEGDRGTHPVCASLRFSICMYQNPIPVTVLARSNELMQLRSRNLYLPPMYIATGAQRMIQTSATIMGTKNQEALVIA